MDILIQFFTKKHVKKLKRKSENLFLFANLTHDYTVLHQIIGE